MLRTAFRLAQCSPIQAAQKQEWFVARPLLQITTVHSLQPWRLEFMLKIELNAQTQAAHVMIIIVLNNR